MISKGRLCHENNIKDDTYCCRKDLIVAICVALNKLSCLPSWNRHTEIMKSSAVKQCQPAGYRQLQAVNIFRIHYKLLTALTAATSCHQLWQVLQAFASSDSCYKLLPAVTSCCQFWQLLQAVASFDSCYKLLPALTAVTSCRQLWQLLPALTGLTSCWHWQLLQAVSSNGSC